MIAEGLVFLAAGGTLAWARRAAQVRHPDRFPVPRVFGYDYGLTPGVVLDHAVALIPDKFRVGVADAPEAVAAPEHAGVFFAEGEPTTFAEYAGQEHVVSLLEDAVNQAARRGVLALEPQCFIGQAGLGKTLLAKVVANELAMRANGMGLPAPLFIEAFPADMPDVEALDALMRRVVANPGCVLFIDEVHTLAGPHSLKLYMTLAERRYLFHRDPQPTGLPPVTLLAATTDYGAMHQALKRRWKKHQLEPASDDQLLGYVLNRGFPIERRVAQRLVERTKFAGAPWEALELFSLARTAAEARGSDAVEDADVDRVFAMQKVDELGLRWMDRRVISSLFGQPRYRNGKGGGQEFVAYAASENNTCMLAGVDKAEYRDAIRPRLMARGLLEIKPTYGQALTAKAVELYGKGVTE